MFRTSIRNFLRCEAGAATVEGIIWISFFFTFVVAIMDICIYFLGHGWAIRALHQENRNYIIGVYSSCDELETALDARIQELSPSASTSCTTYEENDQKISQVTITLIGRELGLGLWTFFIDGVSVSTSGLQVIESPISVADAGGSSDTDTSGSSDTDSSTDTTSTDTSGTDTSGTDTSGTDTGKTRGNSGK